MQIDTTVLDVSIVVIEEGSKLLSKDWREERTMVPKQAVLVIGYQLLDLVAAWEKRLKETDVGIGFEGGKVKAVSGFNIPNVMGQRA